MNNMNQATGNDGNISAEHRTSHSLGRWLGMIFLRLVVPLLILGAGGWYLLHQMETSPKSTRQRPSRRARLVEVIPIKRQDVPVTIDAMGTVIPARQVTLQPQVAGKVITMCPEVIPGGLLRTDQTILQIEPNDYELLVRQRQSEVANAQRDLKLEHGNQSIARQEYELLGEVIVDQDKELVLRQPQLASAEAYVQAAQARLEQAQLDLERTEIMVPFNAIVKEKYVDLGAMVSPGSPLVTLTGTDEYWVEVAVPVNELKWITVPVRRGEGGSSVRIYNPSGWDPSVNRLGRVIRLNGELETNGRMAKLLVSIEDPLALETDQTDGPALLIGSYVRVEIEGRTIPSVIPLKRQYLRDGDNVWLYSSEDTLRIQPVDIVYRGKDNILIAQDFDTDAQIIVTDLAAPVEGMPLRLQEQPADEESPPKDLSEITASLPQERR